MKQEIAQEWVKRLRSGEIPQGQNYLAVREQRCCLGVLADMAVEADACTYIRHEDGATAGFWTYGYRDELAVLPNEVIDWAGAKSDWACFTYDNAYPEGKIETLSELNDNGFTFDQIADIIEWAWEQL